MDVQGRTALERRPLLLWGVSKVNGWQIYMKDRVLVEYGASAGFGVLGVFDGHGNGGHTLDYVARNLQGKLMSQPEQASAYCAQDPNLIVSLIALACHNLDKGLRGVALRPMRDGRTMAIIALVCDCHFIVANVGDSRCILVRKKEERLGGRYAAGAEEEASSNQGGRGGGGPPHPRLDATAVKVIPMSKDHKPNLLD